MQLTGTTTTTLTISWNPALFSNAQAYLVSIISTDGSHTNLISIEASLAAAPYTVTQLSPGQTYEVGVDAGVGGQRFEVGAFAGARRTSEWRIFLRAPYGQDICRVLACEAQINSILKVRIK